MQACLIILTGAGKWGGVISNGALSLRAWARIIDFRLRHHVAVRVTGLRGFLPNCIPGVNPAVIVIKPADA